MSNKLSSFLESRSTDVLKPELSEKLQTLVYLCKVRGIDLGVGCTVRGPAAQAKMWCRSRSEVDILRVKKIISKSAPLLASLLKEEYAAIGPQCTTHLPGQSWHQWGEAVDIFAIVEGIAIWEGSIARAVADIAEKVGINHSYNRKFWQPKSRHWHVQLNDQETPLLSRDPYRNWEDVEVSMLERFDL